MIDPNAIPNTVRFQHELDTHELWAWGRNGGIASTGVHVTYWGGDNKAVALLNVTSKGHVSDAVRLVLPISALPEFVAILQSFYVGPLGKLALEVLKNTTVGDNET